MSTFTMPFDPNALRRLPPLVDEILREEGAAPRLRAHLTLVHDVAVALCAKANEAWPTLRFDENAVAFGAASHDIGKARISSELSVPGTTHEHVGERMLLERAVPTQLARFARSHGEDVAELPLEDLLVIAADTSWKGKRVASLDRALAEVIANATRSESWEVFLLLDEILTDIAADADARLHWQGEHSPYPDTA